MLSRRRFTLIFTLCALFLLSASVASAKNIIVSDAQEGGVRYEVDGNTNAGGAMATLRELFAKVVESGDTVYIGENWDTGDVDGNGEVDETWETTTWLARFIVTEPIEISKDVAIYASCPGRRLRDDTIEVQPTTEADMSDDLTTFEGQGKSQIFRITGGAKVTIANLRIHGAYTGSAEKGGAVAIFEGSNVTIRNCIIKETHSSTYEDGRSYGKGGGIYVNASRLTLQSSDIRNNTAYGTVGGGIALESGAYALITNSTITSNDTPAPSSGSAIEYGNGGGIIVMAGCSADIVNSVITKNTGSRGGGICVEGDSSKGIARVTLTGCTVSENTCKYDGGGIYVSYSSAAIKNCTISDNTCTGIVYDDGSHHHGNGGGIYVYQPQESLTVTDCVITGNSAYLDGGGIKFDSSYSITPTAANCLIAYNTAYSTGGGIAVNGVAEIDNFTIIGNKAVGYTTTDGQRWYGQGGGIGVSNGWLKMTNSTVTKNSAGYIGGGGIYYSGTVGMECMLSNCTIVDNSAENGPEIFRDSYVYSSRIPFINSLIYNTASPDKAIYVLDNTYDRQRSMFFNCAIPEELKLDKYWPSFDIVQIASWDNPVSSSVEVRGIAHTVYRIEDNPALKPIIGKGANRIIRPSDTYVPALDYTSPSFDQIGTTRIDSPDIGAVEYIVAPVLSADTRIEAVKEKSFSAVTITDTMLNKSLTWTTSGDIPAGVTLTKTKKNCTISGSPTTAGDYEFTLTARNSKGSSSVKITMIVYEAPVLPESAITIQAVKDTAITSRTITAAKGNHLRWRRSGTFPAGLTVTSNDTSLTISGTATAAGDYSCKFTAINLAGSADLTAAITVYAKPVLSKSSITASATKNQAMTAQTVAVTAGNHLTWTRSGTFPAGLTVTSSDTSLTISGTPTAAGDYSSTFTASNFAGSASFTAAITVYAKPVLSKSSITASTVKNQAMSAQTVSVTEGNHLRWTRSGTFPAGLTITSSDTSLTISGTPTAEGDYSSTFTASNPAGNASFTAAITVYTAPALSDTSATINAVEGEAITSRTITLTAGNHIAWATSGTIPGGLTVTSNDEGFTVGGTPSAGSGGSYTFTVTARNYAGSSSAEITATVGAKNYSADVTEQSTLASVLGGLTEHQLQTIETLRLNGNVSDLSSLDVLPNLNALDLTQATSLTSIDLRSNDKILSLDISGNTSIRTLDISGSSLERVYARSCSNLETVKAENCAGLKVLICPSCKISGLYITGNTGLETLDFSGNAMRKFSVRGFNGLTSIDCGGQTIDDFTLRKSFDAWDFVGAAGSEDENVRNIKGYDNLGGEISCDYASDTGIAAFSKVPYKITYNYMISSDISMDVALSGNVELSAPVITSMDVRISATEGTAITPATITASPADYLTWTTSGRLPSGLTGRAASDGSSFTVSGTPLRGTAGTYTYTVIAYNSAGSADAVVTVTVISPEAPPVLSGQTFGISAKEGTAITALTITASSDSQVSWTVSGTLPDGLTGRAASDGKSFTVSGTPSQGSAGNYTYTVTAMNGGGGTSATINITVATVINSQGSSSLNDVLNNLSSESLSHLTSISIGNNITDLRGIERLTNLVNLDLTEATSLRTVNFDGNTSVKSVDLSGNSSITTLTLGNSNVERVNAEGCASLDVVSIEGNTSIKELNVNRTNVSEINARDCSSLEVLNCSSCRVSRIVLDGCVNLKHLNFAGNAVRRFNARGLNSLREFSCGGQRTSVNAFSLVFNLSNFLTASQISAADTGDENVKNVKGYDASGNEITTAYNSATGEATFSQVPAKVMYDYDTGFGSEYMDVTVSASSEGDSSDLGSSGGGCNEFSSVIMLLALVGMLSVKKK